MTATPPTTPTVGLRFDRVDGDPVIVFRGGRWNVLPTPTCDEVDAAGSIDPWQAEAVAACQAVFGTPTGDWRCGGLEGYPPLELPPETVAVQCAL